MAKKKAEEKKTEKKAEKKKDLKAKRNSSTNDGNKSVKYEKGDTVELKSKKDMQSLIEGGFIG